MSERNEGERIVDFAAALDMAINNIFTHGNYTTHGSGMRQAQVNFLMCRKCHPSEVKNDMIIKDESVMSDF